MEIDWNYESPLFMIYDAKDTQNTPDKPIIRKIQNIPIRQVPEILQQRILDPQKLDADKAVPSKTKTAASDDTKNNEGVDKKGWNNSLQENTCFI